MADNSKYVQAQAFNLAGAGCVLGATTITLISMLQNDGETTLTMTNFGTKGFATIEPGNGTREEQISFTGITQNANGTATLTGVSNVLFIDPYTETSGVAMSHPGGVILIISNTAGFYNRIATKNDDETITGLWNFPNNGNTPTLGTVYAAPTTDLQVASKKYVDDVAIAGAPDATTTVKGIVQIATQAQTDAKTATGSTGASIVVTPALQRSTLESDYVVDTGAANAYVITPSPAITAYTAGQIFTWKAANTNTTTSTIAVNGLAAKTIKKLDGATNLGAGDIVAGQIVVIEYDGTNFQMSSPISNGLPAITSGQINEFLTTTNGTAYSFGRVYDYQLFTGSGTWTKPTNMSGNEMVMVEVWGGGGGGGSAGANTEGGGGGGGGAFVQGFYRASDLASTITVTIAAGGAAGTVGGNTTFGALITAFGGGAGQHSSGGGNSAPGGGGGGALGVGGPGVSDTTGGSGGAPAGGASTVGVGGFGGGGGGAGTSGGVSGYGGAGGGGNTSGTTGSTGGATIYGGGGGGAGGSVGGAAGGVSYFGGAGGAGGTANSAGTVGAAPAGGGGGGSRVSAGTGTGGTGARGEVRVWTFY